MLLDGDEVVGAQLAFYSERSIDGRRERFCNLGAWCVLPEYRFHSLRLLKAALGQQGYHFTDLSPSGNVVDINSRLEFRFLDTTTILVPNLPWPSRPGRSVISSDPALIERTLTGRDLRALSRPQRPRRSPPSGADPGRRVVLRHLPQGPAQAATAVRVASSTSATRPCFASSRDRSPATCCCATGPRDAGGAARRRLPPAPRRSRFGRRAGRCSAARPGARQGRLPIQRAGVRLMVTMPNAETRDAHSAHRPPPRRRGLSPALTFKDTTLTLRRAWPTRYSRSAPDCANSASGAASGSPSTSTSGSRRSPRSSAPRPPAASSCRSTRC